MLFRSRLADAQMSSFEKFIQSAVQSVAKVVDQGLLEDATDADPELTMGWQWVAVLDDKVCDRCEFFDGQRWDSQYEPVGDAPEFPENPPLHPNCRCSLVPVDLSENAAPTDRRLDDYFKDGSPKALEAVFGESAATAFGKGEISGSQMLRSNVNPIRPDSLSALRKLWKEAA